MREATTPRLEGSIRKGLLFTDFLNPGTYTIDNGSGGAHVGAFRTSLTLPSNLVWSNEDSITTVSRSQDLTVTWTGVDSNRERVDISGSSANTNAGVNAAFQCTAEANLGTFTVPSWVLSALPASGPSDQGPVGFLAVGKANLRGTGTFRAPGVDSGVQQYELLQLKNVTYQ